MNKIKIYMTPDQIKKAWKNENEPVGKLLGYPQCCIDQFCEDPPLLMKYKKRTQDDLDRFNAAHIRGHYTGFIPCTNHAKQILSGEISIYDIIKKRDPDMLPFPDQW